jgi:hypothetical protein
LRFLKLRGFVFFRRFGGQGRMIYVEASRPTKTFLASEGVTTILCVRSPKFSFSDLLIFWRFHRTINKTLSKNRRTICAILKKTK